MSTIDISKKYKARDGREVRIHAIDGPNPNEPVIASILNRGAGWIVSTWPMSGIAGPGADCADLIEVREPREFKASVVTEEAKARGYASAFPIGYLTTYEADDENDGFEVITVREVLEEETALRKARGESNE